MFLYVVIVWLLLVIFITFYFLPLMEESSKEDQARMKLHIRARELRLSCGATAIKDFGGVDGLEDEIVLRVGCLGREMIFDG